MGQVVKWDCNKLKCIINNIIPWSIFLILINIVSMIFIVLCSILYYEKTWLIITSIVILCLYFLNISLIFIGILLLKFGYKIHGNDSSNNDEESGENSNDDTSKFFTVNIMFWNICWMYLLLPTTIAIYLHIINFSLFFVIILFCLTFVTIIALTCILPISVTYKFISKKINVNIYSISSKNEKILKVCKYVNVIFTILSLTCLIYLGYVLSISKNYGIVESIIGFLSSYLIWWIIIVSLSFLCYFNIFANNNSMNENLFIDDPEKNYIFSKYYVSYSTMLTFHIINIVTSWAISTIAIYYLMNSFSITTWITVSIMLVYLTLSPTITCILFFMLSFIIL